MPVEKSNRKNKSENESNKPKTFLKATSFLGETGTGGNVACIDVADGKIIRIRPLHYDWKYKDIHPWRVEVHGQVIEPPLKTLLTPHGLAYKKRIYSPNRILYPMKRVDWNPNGERNPQNRGKSKYMRISWNEATDIIANELKRVIKNYGPEAVLLQADGHGESKIVHPCHAANINLLNHLGGYTLQTRNPDSWEGWYWGAKHAWGNEPLGLENQGNMIADILTNCELLIVWGGDPETTAWGFAGQMASRLSFAFTEIGIKQIYICPELNYGAAVHADKWIPILPNTDAAMRLAIAYQWIKGDTYDKAYVASHTYGFKKFVDYVMGKEDGVAKTPQWAEKKCGVQSRIIKALAREIASKRTSIGHIMGGGSIRGPFSSEPARLEVLLLAMQGLGRPGVHQVLMGTIVWDNPPVYVIKPMPMFAFRGTAIPQQAALGHCMAVKDFMKLWGRPGRSVPPICRPTDGIPDKKMIPKQIIPKNLIHDALLNPPISWYGTTLWAEPLEDQFVKYTYPAKGCSEVHMIWTDTPCWITCWNDSNSYIKALQSNKIEFILAQHPWMENDCLFADILLPINTKFEEKDINVDATSGQVDTIFLEEECTITRGESKSDYEAVAAIAEKLGLYKEYTEGRSIEDWRRFGFENSGVQEFISYEELKEKGYYIIPSVSNWKYKEPDLKSFYDNPEANPLKTPSGKIEFYSQNIAKFFPNDEERPPVPHWIERSEYHDERTSSERAKKFPLLMMSNHGRWRVHAQLDDVNWFHEIPTGKVKGPDGYLYEPLWIHPSEAAKRGIKDGDVVNVFNERGQVLCGAYVTERIMPGIVYVDHGSRYDPIVPGELDRGGAINTISPHQILSKNATGMATSGYLVEVKRADLDELRRQYPEAFNRPYNQDSGLRFERVFVKGDK
jgi:anaerobic selenocysteine-containing dehydrogenase